MSIKTYRIAIEQSQIDDLHERLMRVRLPDNIKGAGWERGVPVSYLQKLVDYWRSMYDWRKQETALVALIATI